MTMTPAHINVVAYVASDHPSHHQQTRAANKALTSAQSSTFARKKANARNQVRTIITLPRVNPNVVNTKLTPTSLLRSRAVTYPAIYSFAKVEQGRG